MLQGTGRVSACLPMHKHTPGARGCHSGEHFSLNGTQTQCGKEQRVVNGHEASHTGAASSDAMHVEKRKVYAMQFPGMAQQACHSRICK